MSKTVKLYLENSYLTSFEAKVMDFVTEGKEKAVILDQTAFYPTSGGQMHDTGVIGKAKVDRVEIKDGQIYHFIDKDPGGETVIGQINWPRRFDFMQQHSGFHILAQSFLRETGGETVSSHLGETMSTIDVQLENIDWKDLTMIEDRANSIIWEDRPVNTYFVNEDELASLKLRKFEVEDRPVRIVDIKEFDLDPCGGTHVRRTGEVGGVKIVGMEKVRDCLRFSFVAGKRAFTDYQKKAQVIRSLCNIFSTGQDDLVYSAKKSLDTAKYSLKEVTKFKEKLIEYEVENFIELAAKNHGLISKEFSVEDTSFLKQLAGEIIKKAQVTVLFGHKAEVATLIFSSSQAGVDLREVFSQIQPLFSGRGGGKPDFIQGGGGRTDTLSETLNKAEILVRQQLELNN